MMEKGFLYCEDISLTEEMFRGRDETTITIAAPNSRDRLAINAACFIFNRHVDLVWYVPASRSEVPGFVQLCVTVDVDRGQWAVGCGQATLVVGVYPNRQLPTPMYLPIRSCRRR